MQHWLNKLTDLAAIPGDEGILKLALATFTEQIGFAGYAYLNIQPGRAIAISNYLRISEERDSRFTKSRTAVSLIPGQHDVVDFRLPD